MPYYNEYSHRSESSGDGRRGRRSNPPENTNKEAVYLRKLIDSETPVSVVLRSGERLEGNLRYYDRDYFSMRLTETGVNVLVRKENVLYLAEI